MPVRPERPLPPGLELGLFTDLYELTMAEAYRAAGMDAAAVFDLHVRTLPRDWNFLVACGLEDALAAIEHFRFGPEAIAYLERLDRFSDDLLEALATFRFAGDVYAPPEGTPVFAREPLVQVEAPVAHAQLLETVLLNQVNLQTLLASKAARIVEAAGDADVVDFGMRRIPGLDAGLRSARAFWVGGVTATSNVLAGAVYDVPVTGTMAHSFVQAHDDELQALRDFAAVYPDAVLLVDTYDTLEGVRRVVQLADELGDDFRASGIRLDSGDLGELARQSRRLLDDAGLEDVSIFASGGLDEHAIAKLLAGGAPVDGFGAGSHLGTPHDAPALDIVYKLAAYDGSGVLKTSTDKQTLPGRKQVVRREEEGTYVADTLTLWDEDGVEGEALVERVMTGGRRGDVGDHHVARERFARERRRLPEHVRGIERAAEPYPVELSPGLGAMRDRLVRQHRA